MVVALALSVVVLSYTTLDLANLNEEAWTGGRGQRRWSFTSINDLPRNRGYGGR